MHKIFLSFLLSVTPLASQDAPLSAEEAKAKHQDGCEKLTEDQDILSADVQDLIDEQTAAKVIELLKEVEVLMAEAIDELETQDTGGATIAIQTEIIEKIFEAAQEKSKQSSQNQGQKPKDGKQGEQGQQQGQSPGQLRNQAMLEMMQRMMGKEPGKGAQGSSSNDKSGQKGGEGQQGDSDAANSNTDGPSTGEPEVRRVPKASGLSGATLPREFQKALDAYNRSQSSQ